MFVIKIKQVSFYRFVAYSTSLLWLSFSGHNVTILTDLCAVAKLEAVYKSRSERNDVLQRATHLNGVSVAHDRHAEGVRLDQLLVDRTCHLLTNNFYLFWDSKAKLPNLNLKLRNYMCYLKHSTSFLKFDFLLFSVARLGYFWKSFVTKIVSTYGPKNWQLSGLFENHNI